MRLKISFYYMAEWWVELREFKSCDEDERVLRSDC